MGGLPDQEPRQAPFAAGADEQVGIGQAGRVQVRGDVAGGDGLGELCERDPGPCPLVEQRPQGVGDLLAAVVADGDGQLAVTVAFGGAAGGQLERVRGGVGQGVKAPGDVHPPAARRPGQALGDDVLDHLHQVVHLGRWPLAQVVGRGNEDRHVPDAEAGAPAQDLLDVLAAVAMADAGIAHAHLSGPPAVAVHDQRDVPRHGPAGQPRAQPPRVERVDRITQEHAYNLVHEFTAAGSCAQGDFCCRQVISSMVSAAKTRPCPG